MQHVSDEKEEQGLVEAFGELVDKLYRHHGPQGMLARSWPTGSMVIWSPALLGLSLLLYYF